MHPERNGHTLIELLISLVLISVVIILLMSVFTANVKIGRASCRERV